MFIKHITGLNKTPNTLTANKLDAAKQVKMQALQKKN